jgi:hypothetical protein
MFVRMDKLTHLESQTMTQNSKAVHTQTLRTPNERKGAYKKRIAHMVYSVIGGSTLLLAGMPPIPANAEPAPRCVEVSWNPTPAGPRKTLLVSNLCRVTRRVNVILANDRDTGCYSYPPNTSARFTRSGNAKITSVVKC